MPHSEIKNTIIELKSELANVEQDTRRLEEQLDLAHAGIERYAPEAAQDLARFLRSEVDQFEVGHPRITALMNQAMTALSNLGI